MAKKFIEDVVIEDARIFSRNFEGKEVVKNGIVVNGEGKRTFCVAIPDDVAQVMIEDKWDVRLRRPSEDDENQEPSYYLPVELKYRDRTGRPLGSSIYPHIYMYVGRPGRKENELTEDSVSILDGINLTQVDLTIHPRWVLSPKTGEEYIKAYLLDGRFTIKESRMASKYAQYAESADEDEVPFD